MLLQKKFPAVILSNYFWAKRRGNNKYDNFKSNDNQWDMLKNPIWNEVGWYVQLKSDDDFVLFFIKKKISTHKIYFFTSFTTLSINPS